MKKFERFSPEQRVEIWDRLQGGESMPSIAGSFGRFPSAIRELVLRSGGVRPAQRVRPARCLSAPEREEISRGLAEGVSLREIARRLSRSPSTISREVARNGGPAAYRAARAERHAWDRARRPQAGKLARCPRLRREVAAKLAKNWSPEQISRWLAGAYPHNPEMRVSHETIYLALFVQSRGELRKELQRALRSGRTIRRSHHRQPDGRGRLAGMVMISDRPAEVSDRAVPGHWEGDLIMGSKNSAIATLVERSTRFVMLMRIDRPTAEVVRDAMAKKITRLPIEVRRSVTWDQGSEMAQHREFTVATGVPVYFCDPHSPWQRGTNENTNGLLRQYFPKGTDLSIHSQRRLDRVARELNERPRKTLGWVSPLERLAEVLQ
ncbi:MAG: IS30 family transposase [Acidobacteriota bacterium]|nr:IS30 family transposase [Acidobacteriota bacterium]